MPVDVMPRPEAEPDYPRKILVCAYFCSLPDARKKAAREELRRVTKYRDTDGMTDVLLEQLWNLLSGNC